MAGRFENIAFFPAYPAVVGTVARLLGLTTPASWFWLAAGLSTLLFGAALATLYSLCRRDGGDERANRAVWLCAASPFAVYFGVGYTESLYLLASLCAVLHLERHQYLPAAAWGLLGGLTRPTAVVIAAAMLASRLVDQIRWWRGRNEHGVPPMAWLAAISPLLGMAIYSCYVFGVTGHPLMWATVQDGWGRTTQSPVHALSAPLAELVRNPTAMLVATPETVLNLAAALFALAVAYPLSRRLGVGHGVLVVLGTVMPLVGGGLASAGRYTAVAFPIYARSAVARSGGRPSRQHSHCALVCELLRENRRVPLNELLLLTVSKIPVGVNEPDRPEENADSEDQRHQCDQVDATVDDASNNPALQKEVERRAEHCDRHSAESCVCRTTHQIPL